MLPNYDSYLMTADRIHWADPSMLTFIKVLTTDSIYVHVQYIQYIQLLLSLLPHTYITLNKHASYETNYILQSTSYGSISNVIWRRKALKVWHPPPKPRIEEKKKKFGAITYCLQTSFDSRTACCCHCCYIRLNWWSSGTNQQNVAEMGDYHSIVGLWMVLWYIKSLRKIRSPSIHLILFFFSFFFFFSTFGSL